MTWLAELSKHSSTSRAVLIQVLDYERRYKDWYLLYRILYPALFPTKSSLCRFPYLPIATMPVTPIESLDDFNATVSCGPAPITHGQDSPSYIFLDQQQG